MKRYIYSIVNNGQLSDMAEVELMAAIACHEGKSIRILVERKKKQRSLNQNAFFHGPFLEAVVEMFQDKGNDIDAEMAKHVIKEMFGIKKRIKMPDNRMEYVHTSTAHYEPSEFETMMEKCRAWAAVFGYQLPFPGEDRHG